MTENNFKEDLKINILLVQNDLCEKSHGIAEISHMKIINDWIIEDREELVVPYLDFFVSVRYKNIINGGKKILENLLKGLLCEEENKHLRKLVHQDDLTCAFNYRKLFFDVNFLISARKSIFTLVFLDIDDFKKINDKYGHWVGSGLIKSFALNLSLLLPQDVEFYRYGGDEFVILARDMSSVQILPILENIVKVLEEKPIPLTDDRFISLCVSMGVAEYPREVQTLKDIIHLADHMMFSAKREGKRKLIGPLTASRVRKHVA